eukprot:m.44804 g.44804  ORF g.44804 m.44804 type:complete len:423 (+) comp10630_c0_seq1:104-1372(+)
MSGEKTPLFDNNNANVNVSVKYSYSSSDPNAPPPDFSNMGVPPNMMPPQGPPQNMPPPGPPQGPPQGYQGVDPQQQQQEQDQLPSQNRPEEVVAPPSYSDYDIVGANRTAFQMPPMPNLSEQMVRDALVEKMDSKCCAGTKAAREMSLLEVTPNLVVVYRFHTYTERRLTRPAYSPFQGQHIDDASHGFPPQPWDLVVQTPPYFQQRKTLVKVPHTSSVVSCVDCRGSGRRRCHHCNSSGSQRCHHCHGSGRERIGEDTRVCCHCNGSGRHSCHRCNGSGSLVCDTCVGSGRLEMYTELVVNWTTHTSQHVCGEDALGLDPSLIIKAPSTLLLNEEGVRVAPLQNTPVPKIHVVSSRMSTEHERQWPAERILQQKHAVECVPLTKVSANWDNKTFTYWIYGVNGGVHAPDYPQAGCWCCNIL